MGISFQELIDHIDTFLSLSGNIDGYFPISLRRDDFFCGDNSRARSVKKRNLQHNFKSVVSTFKVEGDK